MTIVSMQKINQKLLTLWGQYRHLNHTLAPMQYPDGDKGALLFVGINPSFSIKGWNSVLKKAGTPFIAHNTQFNNCDDVKDYYHWPTNNSSLPSYPTAAKISPNQRGVTV